MKTFLALYFSLFAVAEDDDKKPQGPDTVVTVQGRITEIPTRNVTATKFDLPLQKTPLSVSVVGEQLIESQDAQTVGDALRNVSGVNVTNGFGVFDFFVIRGFDNLSSGLVMFDGAAEPESSYYQLYNVERVEVLKGPAAFLYGANSLSGTVNIVRKRPQFGGNFVDVGVTFGSFQDYQGSFDLNWVDPSGEVAFRFNGLYQDAENYRDDKPSYVQAFNPAVTWKFADQSSLTVNFEYVRNSFSPDNGIPLAAGSIPEVDRKSNFQAPFDQSRQEIHRFRVDFEHRLSDSVVFRDKFYSSRLDWESAGTLFVGALPSIEGRFQALRVFNQLDDEQRFTGNQAEFLISARTGIIRHHLVLGLETARLADRFGLVPSFLPTIDILDPVETANPAFLFPIPGQTAAGDARTLVVAPYLLDRIILSDQVEVFAGARFDFLDHEDPLNGIERTDQKASPLLGLTVSPIQPLTFYASFGRSFAPPSTLETVSRAPEDSRQFEAGLKGAWLGGRLQASLAYYHLERENIAIPDDNGITRQAGDQRSRGVEFELSSEVLPDWFNFVSYAYNDPELTRFRELVQLPFPPGFAVFDRSGNDPAFAPRHLFSFWSQKQFANGVGLGFGGRWVDDQFIAEDNTFSIDSYVVLDAMASYRLRNWSLSVNFKNLTDTEYEGRGFGAFSVVPANTFGVYGTVRYFLGF